MSVQVLFDDDGEDDTFDAAHLTFDGTVQVSKRSEWSKRRRRPDDIVYLGYVERR